MSKKRIHIVSFDIPYPADYGGVIDVFYRIKALHNIGFEIVLHCFEYGKRKPQKELEKFTSEVIYYPRKKSIFALFKKEPFIVATRKPKQLLENLNKDSAPILFEGLHTCGFLNDISLKKRLKFARMHNIEQDYYTALSKTALGWKKLFYRLEAKKLKEFLPILNNAQHILAIQENDFAFFKKMHSSVFLLPVSVPNLEIKSVKQTEKFCLFQGNLSVPENINAVIWLLANIPSLQQQRFVIAGKNPSRDFVEFCDMKEVILFPNPSEDQMDQLIQSARIHILYTEQATGIKLKLLNALLSSGKVIVNPKMIVGTDLEKYVFVAENREEFTSLIKTEISSTANETEILSRWKGLSQYFDVEKNVRIIEQLIDNH